MVFQNLCVCLWLWHSKELFVNTLQAGLPEYLYLCVALVRLMPLCAGDCAIASSFVSYLGPFNKEFRELLITRDFYGGCVKLNIPVTKDMQVTKFLVDDSEVGEWTLQVLVAAVSVSRHPDLL